MARSYPRIYKAEIVQKTPKGVPQMRVTYRGELVFMAPVNGLQQYLRRWEKRIQKIDAELMSKSADPEP